MILFLTLIYVAVLMMLVKLNVLPWNLWTKISPAIWMIVLFLVLFLPLQFFAPSGPILVLQPTVQIIPAVDGLVKEINVESNQRVEKGDILFSIDPTRYQASVDRLSADVDLAKIRLSQSEELMRRGTGRKIDVDRDSNQVASLNAQLRAAEWDLDQTRVKAPDAGWVANVDALQEGARVVSLPLEQAMALVEDKRVLVARIHQIHLRYIEPHQPAELTFKMLPGEVFTATVEGIIPGIAQGQVAPTGTLAANRDMSPGPFYVRLKLDDESVVARLPAGAVGTGNIFTGNMSAAYIIRHVMIWMDAWMNYIVPI